MDERTIASSERTRDLEEAAAIARNAKRRVYSVLVLGRNKNKSFPIIADSGQQRADKMVKEHQVDLKKDDWAAAYPVGDDFILEWNNDLAKVKLEQELKS